VIPEVSRTVCSTIKTTVVEGWNKKRNIIAIYYIFLALMKFDYLIT